MARVEAEKDNLFKDDQKEKPAIKQGRKNVIDDLKKLFGKRLKERTEPTSSIHNIIKEAFTNTEDDDHIAGSHNKKNRRGIRDKRATSEIVAGTDEGGIVDEEIKILKERKVCGEKSRNNNKGATCAGFDKDGKLGSLREEKYDIKADVKYSGGDGNILEKLDLRR